MRNRKSASGWKVKRLAQLDPISKSFVEVDQKEKRGRGEGKKGPWWSFFVSLGGLLVGTLHYSVDRPKP